MGRKSRNHASLTDHGQIFVYIADPARTPINKCIGGNLVGHTHGYANGGILIQQTGIFGFTFSDDYDEVDLGGKVMYKLIDGENMYVAGIGGLGMSRVDPDAGDDDTGWWLSGGVGLEYFFSGLPNLGFSTEVSIVFSDYYDNSSFNTAADTAISAGIHYYFGGPKIAK